MRELSLLCSGASFIYIRFGEANFVSATMFPGVDKLGNIDRKQNVSATMFPSLPRALVNY
jgi:hypothetical protein